VRVPDLVVGDVRAQLAANRAGTTRFLELIERLGRQRVLAAAAELQDYSERLTRAVIAGIQRARWPTRTTRRRSASATWRCSA
jgi:N-methylhydantoinase B